MINKILFCDGCNMQFQFNYACNKATIFRVARKEGWRMGKLFLCPDCKKMIER